MPKSRIQDFLVYDLETGGLPSSKLEAFHNIPITEIALVYVNPELEIIAKTSFLIKPYKDDLVYQAKASEVSGITKDLLLSDGISIEESFITVKDFISSYQTSKSKPRLVGHNIKSFDNKFMENFFSYMDDNLYNYVQKECEDTLEWSHRVFNEAPDYKLGTMCDQFDIELDGAHRALPDTVANAELFIRFMKNLRGDGVVNEHNTIEEQSIIDELNKFQF